MPELPEVQTVCSALRPHLLGRNLTKVTLNVPKVRNVLNKRTLNRAMDAGPVQDLRRRAKYMILEFPERHALLLHLGMSGAFRICPAGTEAAKHERVVWDIDDGNQLRLIDPRRFSQVEAVRLALPGGEPDCLSHLGPEPLGDLYTAGYLFQASRKRKTPAKVFLMDQTVVVGIGNIYASETFFKSGIRPTRAAGRLTRKDCAALVKNSRAVLRQAIKRGGTTLNDYHQPDGSEGKFRIHLHVYGREDLPCRKCKTPVKRITQTGRSTFYCPTCQS